MRLFLDPATIAAATVLSLVVIAFLGLIVWGLQR